MRYPIAIEPGAEEAAAAWVDAALDAGEAVPPPSALESLRQNPDYAGWSFGVITLDPALFDDTVERVNITLPRRVLKRLDALAWAAGESRSGYVAQLTLEEPTHLSKDQETPDQGSEALNSQ